MKQRGGTDRWYWSVRESLGRRNFSRTRERRNFASLRVTDLWRPERYLDGRLTVADVSVLEAPRVPGIEFSTGSAKMSPRGKESNDQIRRLKFERDVLGVIVSWN